MNVIVKRKGRKVQAVFVTDGTLMEPSLESFAAAVGKVLHAMHEGDSVEISFARAGHIPMVCSRDIERIVKQATRLSCELRMTGLPGDLAAIYGRYAEPPAAPEKPGKTGKPGKPAKAQKTVSARRAPKPAKPTKA
jgi:hypothetical protein